MGYLEKKLQAIIMAQGWKFKIGNLFVMTSDNAPSPFVASAYNNGAYNIGGSPYMAFNNNKSSYYQGSYTNNNTYVGALINLNKTIKLRKLAINLENVSGFTNNTRGYVDVYNDGSWVNVYDSGAKTNAWSVDTTLNLNYDGVTQIRTRIVYVSGATAGQGRIKELQVTEWYEKG
jgi:hypothetical protein